MHGPERLLKREREREKKKPTLFLLSLRSNVHKQIKREIKKNLFLKCVETDDCIEIHFSSTLIVRFE